MATKTVSVVTGGTNQAATTNADLNAFATDFVVTGVVGSISSTAGVAPTTGAFAVNAQGSPNMSVRVTQGVNWQQATPNGGLLQAVRTYMNTFEDVTIAANASGSTKFDWIYIALDQNKLQNPGVNKDDIATLYTSRSTLSTVDNGTPPAAGYLIAVVTVTNGAASIINSNIADKRVMSGATAAAAASTGNLVLAANNSGLVKTTVLRQDDTTNTYQVGNSVILTGWGVITGTGGSALSETVTFGVTFLQRPIVFVTSGGDSAATFTYGAGGNTIQGLIAAKAYGVSTTGFTAYLSAQGAGVWAVGNAAFYQWVAIGEI